MIHIISSLQMIFTLLFAYASDGILQSSYVTVNTGKEELYGKFRPQVKKLGNSVIKSFKIEYDDNTYATPSVAMIKKQVFDDLANEIDILSQLDHENIIKIESNNESNDELDELSYKMPYYNYDLLTYTKTTNQFVYKIIYQILNAMNYTRYDNVAHRDIKPDNIMIDDENNAILADFGFATRDVASEDFAGTRDYAAPEVLMCLDKNESCSYDPNQSDLFSLGIMIRKLLKIKILPLFTQRTFDQICTTNLSKNLNTKLSENDPMIAIKAMTLSLMQCQTNKRPSAEYLLQTMKFENWI
eukprot:NODE_269_length_11261_cov_0.600359.p6 type:complete len:300 gc:universal NODE_269_length_11261_cov_0.600359:10220-11119(+)